MTLGNEDETLWQEQLNILRIENGRKEAGLRTLELLATALETDLGEMLKRL
jgi:hypothetical protein